MCVCVWGGGGGGGGGRKREREREREREENDCIEREKVITCREREEQWMRVQTYPTSKALSDPVKANLYQVLHEEAGYAAHQLHYSGRHKVVQCL